VLRIERLEGRVQVYNFEVRPTHTYFVQPMAAHGVPEASPVWVHNNCNVPSSKMLKDNLDAAGHTVGATEAAHHIVPGRMKAAQEARDLIAEAGITINSATNGVPLPRNTKVPNPQGKTVHSTVHTKKYIREVTKELRAVPKEQRADVLDSIATRLEAGTFPH
jgi:hypothetical protein